MPTLELYDVFSLLPRDPSRESVAVDRRARVLRIKTDLREILEAKPLLGDMGPPASELPPDRVRFTSEKKLPGRVLPVGCGLLCCCRRASVTSDMLRKVLPSLERKASLLDRGVLLLGYVCER